MIDLHGQAGLPYINKGVYTGSYQGMRYRLRITARFSTVEYGGISK